MGNCRVHIGHHFYGAGNFGDDLMLAGFFEACAGRSAAARFTCAIPAKRHANQQRRFPSVHWLPYEAAARRQAIAACDVWLGLGDTPFRNDNGMGMLNHLAEEADLCRALGKPMFFLGVGVQNRSALTTPQAQQVIEQAEAIWTRDPHSATLLSEHGAAAKTVAAADLANLWLRHQGPAARQPKTLGWILHFERRESFDLEALTDVLERTSNQTSIWLVQETRRLNFSEHTIFEMLPPAAKAKLSLGAADYEQATLAEMYDAWPAVETLVSSRYHGALVGAWRGARLVAIERCEKLTGLVDQLKVAARLTDVCDADGLAQAVATAQPVDGARLLELANQADQACAAFLACLPQNRRRIGWWERLRRVGKSALTPVASSPSGELEPSPIALEHS